MTTCCNNTIEYNIINRTVSISKQNESEILIQPI